MPYSQETLDRVAAVLSREHNHAASLKENTHVCRIWEDLELTMTKCGSLLGQRNEHMLEVAQCVPLPLDLFPCKLGSHAFIFLAYENHERVWKELIAIVKGKV